MSDFAPPSSRRLVLAGLMLLGGAGLAGAKAATPPPPAAAAADSFQNIGYADWSEVEPAYRLYPGDALEVTFPSAPELNKQLTVMPDGRITLGMVAPVMAADRTIPELQAQISSVYASQLLRPDVEVAVKQAGPLKVFVGGEVGNPGVFDMAGDIDALQAIVQAGDFKTSANRKKVVLIRRGPNGRGMMRVIDLKRGLKTPGADLAPLRRFDIVYVPRTGVAEAGIFIQQYFRDLSPVQFGFSYALNGVQ